NPCPRGTAAGRWPWADRRSSWPGLAHDAGVLAEAVVLDQFVQGDRQAGAPVRVLVDCARHVDLRLDAQRVLDLERGEAAGARDHVAVKGQREREAGLLSA